MIFDSLHLSGPLELTRRAKVLVWDDELEIAEDNQQADLNGPLSSSPRPSNRSVPLPRRRSSSSVDFPPPMRRVSTDAPRPVPFAAKFQRVHPGTTGVTVLEHLERLDAVEASLQRLAVDDSEEVDVGEIMTPAAPILIPGSPSTTNNNIATSPFSVPGSPPLPTVLEVDSMASSMTEEDLIAMSKSTSHVEAPRHTRWSSHAHAGRSIDWAQSDIPKRTVIVEVCLIYFSLCIEYRSCDMIAFGNCKHETHMFVLVIIHSLYLYYMEQENGHCILYIFRHYTYMCVLAGSSVRKKAYE